MWLLYFFIDSVQEFVLSSYSFLFKFWKNAATRDSVEQGYCTKYNFRSKPWCNLMWLNWVDVVFGLARWISSDDRASVSDVCHNTEWLVFPTNYFSYLLPTADLNIRIYLMKKSIKEEEQRQRRTTCVHDLCIILSLIQSQIFQERNIISVSDTYSCPTAEHCCFPSILTFSWTHLSQWWIFLHASSSYRHNHHKARTWRKDERDENDHYVIAFSSGILQSHAAAS